MNSHLTTTIKTKATTKIPQKNKSRNMTHPLLSCADKDAEESLTQTAFANIKKSAKKSSKTKDLNLMSKNKESLPNNKKSL
jgi:hypothetical protein